MTIDELVRNIGDPVPGLHAGGNRCAEVHAAP
jgi:hypothetical protein